MDVVRLVAEPHRREILRLIWNDERSAGHIASAFDVTFGAISQHLTILRRAGLVIVRKDGTRRFYRANRDALGPVAPMLEAMWAKESAASPISDDTATPPRRPVRVSNDMFNHV